MAFTTHLSRFARFARFFVLFGALALSLLNGIAGALAQGSDSGRRMIDDVVAVLGGREKLLALQTLTLEGYGRNPNIGQQMRPESEPLLWMLPDYQRAYDFVNDRYALQYTRRPAFPAVFDNAVYHGGLDGRIAFRAQAGADAVRQSETEARARRIESLHHPLAAVRAALMPGATISDPRTTGTGRSIDVITADGRMFTLEADRQNRPVAVVTRHSDPNLGDVERRTVFGAYEELDGILLPKRLVTHLDRWVEFDIGVMKNSLDQSLATLAAPPAVLQSPPDEGGEAMLSPLEVAPGVWFVTGGGVPSLIVEFEDHLILVEVGSDAKVEALLALADELAPGKPVTQAVISHHHFDHAAGFRRAVAAGLEIITHRVNENWFHELVERPFSIAPDALTQYPRPLMLTAVDDSMTFVDETMEMTLYHLRGSTHGDGILMIYFPRLRLMAQADVWNPGLPIQPHVASLADEIDSRDLDIERILPLHGREAQPFQAFLETVEDWRHRRETSMDGL